MKASPGPISLVRPIQALTGLIGCHWIGVPTQPPLVASSIASGTQAISAADAFVKQKTACLPKPGTLVNPRNATVAAGAVVRFVEDGDFY